MEHSCRKLPNDTRLFTNIPPISHRKSSTCSLRCSPKRDEVLQGFTHTHTHTLRFSHSGSNKNAVDSWCGRLFLSFTEFWAAAKVLPPSARCSVRYLSLNPSPWRPTWTPSPLVLIVAFIKSIRNRNTGFIRVLVADNVCVCMSSDTTGDLHFWMWTAKIIKSAIFMVNLTKPVRNVSRPYLISKTIKKKNT